MHKFIAVAAVWVACLLSQVGTAQDKVPSIQGVIKGTMDCDFKTRTHIDTSGSYKTGSAQLGIVDTYNFKLTVAETTEYTGKITRQPEILSATFLSQKQAALMKFDVDLAVRNPANLDERKSVGKWVGAVPIDTKTGVYNLSGGSALESPLRFAVDAIGKQPAFTDRFAGKLVGKVENKESLGGYTYKRLIAGKTIEFVVKKSDPMKFEGFELAKGPSSNYPHTMVNGRLDYDYETGNWLTDGIRFNYNYNGKDTVDLVTGSIKWVEDENRKTNGKGYYDFNLRFNEEANKGTSTESDAFATLSEEDAFFAVDDSVPCMTGRISYEDKFIAGKEGDEPTPNSSKVTFALNANKITKVQAVNFFKLWMICIGPTNDE